MTAIIGDAAVTVHERGSRQHNMAATTNGGAWSYAVPLEETDGNARPPASRRDIDSDAKSIPKRNSAWDLQSDSETARHRRTSLRANNSAAGRKRSRNALREKRQQDEKAVPNVDDSAWIHRDKLAQIEIQEMEEAGIYMRPSRRSMSAGPGRENGRTSRSASRSAMRRPGSRTSHERQNEILNDEDYTNAYPGYDESPRKRVSTVPSAPEEGPAQQQQREFDPYRDSEIRSPAEVAEEQYTQRQHMVRPSTSRIPVSRVSPVPVPQMVTDRDSPLPRSRAGSQNWSGSFDEMQYARRIRSPSISSQVLLDAEQDNSKITPPGSSNKASSNDENSPPKSRVPRKSAPTGRKTSTSSSARPGSSHQNGKRAPSATATKRPGSSSGHKSRPSTGRHSPPEGEAPWIATMYKPDPRLPPDQQMLPTHAKRMAQEQWEKEGKTGTVYDREFRLLNDEDASRPKAPVLSLDSHNLLPPRSPSPMKDRPSPKGSATGPWPLSPSKSDTKSDNGSVRPGTSGGYKITPTIANTPTIQRSPAPSPGPPAPAPAISHNTTPRIPDFDEKEEAKPKKGCCCVVM